MSDEGPPLTETIKIGTWHESGAWWICGCPSPSRENHWKDRQTTSIEMDECHRCNFRRPEMVNGKPIGPEGTIYRVINGKLHLVTNDAPAQTVEWASLPAEQALELIRTRTPVLAPWEKWSHARGWSRHEYFPVAVDGAWKHISIQPSHGKPDDTSWNISGLDACGIYRIAPNEEEAKRIADEAAIAMGWKLVEPCTAKATWPNERKPTP